MQYTSLLDQFRSQDQQKKLHALAKIPQIILLSLEMNKKLLSEPTDLERENQLLLDQLLLLIYNLNTTEIDEKFELINATNRIIILRFLLKIYKQTLENESELEEANQREQQHQREKQQEEEEEEEKGAQILALEKIVPLVQTSPELLIELAHLFHILCNKREDSKKTCRQALDLIRDKASAQLFSDVLLMIYSIEVK